MNKVQMIFYGVIVSIFMQSPINAQANDCVVQILACQQQLYQWTAPDYEKTIFFHYKVVFTNWDNTVERSTIKLYRKARQIHFFTDKVDMIQDKDEVFLVFHEDKIILQKDQPDFEIATGAMDGFKTFQKSFLESCELIKCQKQNTGEVLLELKTTQEVVALEYLDRIVYRYIPETKKIQEVNSFFKKGYKIKKMQQVFKTLSGHSNYVFKSSARAYFFENNGTLKTKFKHYQFVEQQ